MKIPAVLSLLLVSVGLRDGVQVWPSFTSSLAGHWLLNPGEQEQREVCPGLPWGPICLSEGPPETLGSGSLQLVVPNPLSPPDVFGDLLAFSVDRVDRAG